MLCTWGRGKDGRLGLADGALDHAEPRPVDALAHAELVGVALGNSHGAAASADGALYVWGGGLFGELGLEGVTSAPSPSRVAALRSRRVVNVSCGFYHSACVCDDGSVWSWGWGREGQLGHSEACATPTQIDALAHKPMSSVACGHRSTLVLTRDGQVLWFGELAERSTSIDSSAPSNERPALLLKPRQAEVPRSAVHLAAGGRHAAVVLSNGSLWTWGNGAYGQLGLGDTAGREAPCLVPGLHQVRTAGCGEDHTAAIACRSDDTYSSEAGGTERPVLWLWGRRDYSSRGMAQGLTVPRQLLLNRQFVSGVELEPQLACGYHHSACLLSSGEVISWAAHAVNDEHDVQVYAPPPGRRFIKVACGGFSTAAIAVSGSSQTLARVHDGSTTPARASFSLGKPPTTFAPSSSVPSTSNALNPPLAYGAALVPLSHSVPPPSFTTPSLSSPSAPPIAKPSQCAACESATGAHVKGAFVALSNASSPPTRLAHHRPPSAPLQPNMRSCMIGAEDAAHETRAANARVTHLSAQIEALAGMLQRETGARQIAERRAVEAEGQLAEATAHVAVLQAEMEVKRRQMYEAQQLAEAATVRLRELEEELTFERRQKLSVHEADQLVEPGVSRAGDVKQVMSDAEAEGQPLPERRTKPTFQSPSRRTATPDAKRRRDPLGATPGAKGAEEKEHADGREELNSSSMRGRRAVEAEARPSKRAARDPTIGAGADGVELAAARAELQTLREQLHAARSDAAGARQKLRLVEATAEREAQQARVQIKRLSAASASSCAARATANLPERRTAQPRDEKARSREARMRLELVETRGEGVRRLGRRSMALHRWRLSVLLIAARLHFRNAVIIAKKEAGAKLMHRPPVTMTKVSTPSASRITTPPRTARKEGLLLQPSCSSTASIGPQLGNVTSQPLSVTGDGLITYRASTPASSASAACPPSRFRTLPASSPCAQSYKPSRLRPPSPRGSASPRPMPTIQLEDPAARTTAWSTITNLWRELHTTRVQLLHALLKGCLSQAAIRWSAMARVIALRRWRELCSSIPKHLPMPLHNRGTPLSSPHVLSPKGGRSTRKSVTWTSPRSLSPSSPFPMQQASRTPCQMRQMGSPHAHVLDAVDAEVSAQSLHLCQQPFEYISTAKSPSPASGLMRDDLVTRINAGLEAIRSGADFEQVELALSNEERAADEAEAEAEAAAEQLAAQLESMLSRQMCST